LDQNSKLSITNMVSRSLDLNKTLHKRIYINTRVMEVKIRKKIYKHKIFQKKIRKTKLL